MPFATALGTAAAIRRRDVSPTEVLNACLEEVDRRSDLNVMAWRDDEGARARARVAEDRLRQGAADDLPPFLGVPLPVKDLTAVAGWPTAHGSWGTPEGPSRRSSLVVEAFERAGFVLAGKTTTPPFGLITSTESARHGITRNPWALDRSPGGSSGGAAAAVAAGLFPIAHATDGGGSIRIPASCCGLVGLKPSRGRVLSEVTAWEGGAVGGVVTRDVADTAAVLDVISGPDRLAWWNAPAPSRPFADAVRMDPPRLRVGLLDEDSIGLPVDPVCVEAARRLAHILEAAGHEIRPASLPMDPASAVAFAEMADSGLGDYDDVDWDRTEPYVQRSREVGAAVDSLRYVRAVHQLQLDSRRIVAHWGRDWDVLLTPTMTIEPPPAGAVGEAANRGDWGLVVGMAGITSRFNVTGQPAVSLPVHLSPRGLPVGAQLVAGPWEESLLLSVAAQVERSERWAERLSPLKEPGASDGGGLPVS